MDLFPSVIPWQHNVVHVEYPWSPAQKGLCVKPLSSLELLWVNNISNLFVSPPPVPLQFSLRWLDKCYSDVWVPKDVLVPLLKESIIPKDYYDNLIVTCWVGRIAVLCLATGPLMDSFSAVIIDSSLHSKLYTAIEGRESLPANCSVFIDKQIRHIKLNVSQGAIPEDEVLLAAVGTEMHVFVYQLSIKENDKGEKVNIKLVETLPFKSQISNLVFTKDYLAVITSDGGIYLWEPQDGSRLRVLKKGSSVNARFMGTPGNHYSTVLVADEQTLLLYDFRGKQTYQRFLKDVGDGYKQKNENIQAVQSQPSHSNHVFLHTKSLHLYDIRYFNSPFITWSRGRNETSSVHSLLTLPGLDDTNFIVSSTTSGEVRLYQYRNGGVPQTETVTKPKWSINQPLSELATQFNPFSQTKFLQTSIPHPIQAPYLFSTMQSVNTYQAAEVRPLFSGVAILPNWILDHSDLDFQLFYISHYGDVYTQTLTQYNFTNTTTTKKDWELSKLGEIAASYLLERSKDFEVFIEIHKSDIDLDNIEIKSVNEADEASVLRFLDKINFPVTAEDVSKGAKQGIKEAYEVLQAFETGVTHEMPNSTNSLVKEKLNPRVAFVPVESIPMIGTMDESNVDPDMEPNLDVYFVNSSVIGPSAPLTETTTPARSFLSKSGATAHNRLHLENLFSQQMAEFFNTSKLPNEIRSIRQPSSSSTPTPRRPPAVAARVVSARSSQNSQRLGSQSLGSQGFSGSQRVGSQSLGSQGFSDSQGFSASQRSGSFGSQGLPGSQSFGSQGFSGSQDFSDSASLPDSQNFSGSQSLPGSQSLSGSLRVSSSQPTGSQPPARPRKKRALGF